MRASRARDKECAPVSEGRAGYGLRAEPRRLRELGYEFRQPELGRALEAALSG